jgi:phenylpropionate dioxygenase-like ring-hydroxylating dioxygenase large terminal subunit
MTMKPIPRLDRPDDGKLLPPAAFTNAALFADEMRAIFERSWVHVADLTELPRAGDYVAAQIGPSPVIVVRGDDGALRAFLNACRHRGATLAEGAGNCGRQLRCPYHAWSYSTAGELVGVPYREEFGCRTAGLDLVPVRVGTVGPLVFACLDADAPPLDEWVGDLGPALARARGGEMEAAFQIDYEVPVNWKIYVENGLEGYHIGFVHDLLADLVMLRSDGERAPQNFYERWSSYTLAPLNAQYRDLLPPPSHLSPEERERVRFGHVFPNLIPVLTPGDFSYLRIDPIAPDRIRLRGRSFDLGGPATALREFRREAFDRTNKQDIAVVERVMRGLRARGLPAGVHADMLEGRIAHFERQVVDALAR